MIDARDATGSEPPMIDCRTAANMLWDYLDGGLDDVTREAVRRHVERCAHCFPHADFGQVVLDAVAEVRAAQRISEADCAPVRASVLARLRAEGYTGS